VQTLLSHEGDDCTLLLRRPTPEVLDLRNRWEKEWACFLNCRRVYSLSQQPVLLSMEQFRFWMANVTDDELRLSYRKWSRTPEEHVEHEYERAMAG